MSNIPFKNFTRYRTTDLEALIERVAQSITALTGEAAKLNSRVQRIEFHEYSPSDPNETYRTWDGQTNKYSTHNRRKFVGNISHTRPERIPLLHPRLIWENPLAALTNGADGEECAPYEMLKRIAEVLSRTMDFDPWRHTREGRQLEVELGGLVLRIDRKTAAKVGDVDKKREKLRLAIGSVNESYYEIRSSLHHLAKFIHSMEVASRHDNSPEIAAQLLTARNAYVALAVVRDGGNEALSKDLKARRLALGGTSEEE